MIKELKRIFSDSYVLVIFFLGGLLYPLLYGYVYSKGMVEEMPVAVVDDSDGAASRRFIREVDATREAQVVAKCTNLDEASEMMRKGKVHGILYFPSDYDERLVGMEQATVSTYADMSSFLYYKNLTMAANHVMLQELKDIEGSRYAATGLSEESVNQLIDAIPSEENIPYNATFSYLFFILMAVVVLVVQQTMFYGISIVNGTLYEDDKIAENSLLGRCCAYTLIYIGIAAYCLGLVPMLFGVPQRGSFLDLMVLIVIFVVTCVAFSFVFSRFVRHRETVFVVLLFMSPVLLFLSGCAWPVTSFPHFWKMFSYLFPSTFAIQAFNNLSAAGCTMSMLRPQIVGLLIQFAAYAAVAFALDQVDHNEFRTLVASGKEKFRAESIKIGEGVEEVHEKIKSRRSKNQ